MYVITGATGNVGKRIAENLLQHRKPVRVIARDASRLKSFTDKAAEASTGSLKDPAFLAGAFTGAVAVFTMIPPDLKTENARKHQDDISKALVLALKDAGVKRVVNLSSRGAELGEGSGPLVGLGANEQRMNQLQAVDILHLRPTYFMENLLGFIPLIKNLGITGSTIKPDVAFPMIATQDIAHFATERLLALDFHDKTIADLLGPRDYSMQEATRILGNVIGKPDVAYVQFSEEDAGKAMVAAGLSADVVNSILELNRVINEGRISSGNQRNKQNTTPTTLEQFSEIFAAVYKE